MRIFGGFAGEGASNERGVLENGNFRLFYPLIFRIFTSKATTIIILFYVVLQWLFNDTEIDDLEWPRMTILC